MEWEKEVVKDIVDQYTDEWLNMDADVRGQGILTCLVRGTVNHMTSVEQIKILDAYGCVDLSDPGVDLALGWAHVREVLADMALSQAVLEAMPPETLL